MKRFAKIAASFTVAAIAAASGGCGDLVGLAKEGIQEARTGLREYQDQKKQNSQFFQQGQEAIQPGGQQQPQPQPQNNQDQGGKQVFTLD